jgi:hypothetical protein
MTKSGSAPVGAQRVLSVPMARLYVPSATRNRPESRAFIRRARTDRTISLNSARSRRREYSGPRYLTIGATGSILKTYPRRDSNPQRPWSLLVPRTSAFTSFVTGATVGRGQPRGHPRRKKWSHSRANGQPAKQGRSLGVFLPSIRLPPDLTEMATNKIIIWHLHSSIYGVGEPRLWQSTIPKKFRPTSQAPSTCRLPCARILCD